MQGRWVLAVTDAVEKEEGLLTNSGAPGGNVGGAAHDDEGTGLFRAHQREDGADIARAQPAPMEPPDRERRRRGPEKREKREGTAALEVEGLGTPGVCTSAEARNSVTAIGCGLLTAHPGRRQEEQGANDARNEVAHVLSLVPSNRGVSGERGEAARVRCTQG